MTVRNTAATAPSSRGPRAPLPATNGEKLHHRLPPDQRNSRCRMVLTQRPLTQPPTHRQR